MIMRIPIVRRIAKRYFNYADVPAELVEAGRAWQRDNPLRALAADAEILFCVPVKGKAIANDWRQVQRNLGVTLHSLIDQTDGRWRAVVCCQDRPDLPVDPRIEFFAYPVPAEPNTMDKRGKIRAIYRHHAERQGWDGYAFVLDADDVLHPRLVEHFLTDRSRSGYILTRGYVYDVGADLLAVSQPRSVQRPLAKPFFRMCGSCSAIRFDLREGPGFLEMLKSRGWHRHQKSLLKAFGVMLEDVPFPAALYVVNHGDNFLLLQGRDEEKTDYTRRNKVGSAIAAKARTLFRIDRIRSAVDAT